MSGTRRRAAAAGDRRPPPRVRPAQTPGSKLQASHVAVVVALIALLYLSRGAYLTRDGHPTARNAPVLEFSARPDDERAVSDRRLVLEDYVAPGFREAAVVCMPSVTRANAEYVSNSVKSFRLATRNSTSLRRVVVYSMDDPPSEPAWLGSVFEGWLVTNELPSWLEVLPREGVVKQPRGTTLGDSWERVVWRSKEALDYAQVLERCADATQAAWVIVVQDDVLFGSSINDAATWAERSIVDEVKVVNGRRVARVCSGSLFDIGDAGSRDGDALRSSNMVARVWRRHDVDGWVKHFREMYDAAPVDWLADSRCQRRRGWVPVMWPNAVRHRGRVSSFAQNHREGLLT